MNDESDIWACGEQSPVEQYSGTYFCTRPLHHAGEHEARDGAGTMLARWLSDADPEGEDGDDGLGP